VVQVNASPDFAQTGSRLMHVPAGEHHLAILFIDLTLQPCFDDAHGISIGVINGTVELAVEPYFAEQQRIARGEINRGASTSSPLLRPYQGRFRQCYNQQSPQAAWGASMTVS
jgi:hypothetical protein